MDNLERVVLKVLPKSQRILNMALSKSLREDGNDFKALIDYIKQLESIIHLLLEDYNDLPKRPDPDKPKRTGSV